MGWDQKDSRQDVQSFLLDFLDVDPNELLREAIAKKLEEIGLTFELEIEVDEEVFSPNKITFSDGRIFVEALTGKELGDDWCNDYYSFVEVGEPYEITSSSYADPGAPVISKELIHGDMLENPSIAVMREQGNALTPGMGDEIADFFTSQGIKDVSFESAGFCVGGCCAACGDAPEAPSKICDCSDCHGNSNP